MVAEVLSESQREDISIYISAGEWGLALETLCEFLSEKELPISSQAYKILKKVESLRELNCGVLDNLQNQLKD